MSKKGGASKFIKERMRRLVYAALKDAEDYLPEDEVEIGGDLQSYDNFVLKAKDLNREKRKEVFALRADFLDALDATLTMIRENLEVFTKESVPSSVEGIITDLKDIELSENIYLEWVVNFAPIEDSWPTLRDEYDETRSLTCAMDLQNIFCSKKKLLDTLGDHADTMLKHFAKKFALYAKSKGPSGSTISSRHYILVLIDLGAPLGIIKSAQEFWTDFESARKKKTLNRRSSVDVVSKKVAKPKDIETDKSWADQVEEEESGGDFDDDV